MERTDTFCPTHPFATQKFSVLYLPLSLTIKTDSGDAVGSYWELEIFKKKLLRRDMIIVFGYLGEGCKNCVLLNLYIQITRKGISTKLERRLKVKTTLTKGWSTLDEI